MKIYSGVLNRIFKARAYRYGSGALLIFLCLLSLSACNPGAQTGMQIENCYDVYAVFSEDMRTAELSEEILYTNTSSDTLDSVKFHLYPNAFTETAVNNYLASKNESALKTDGTAVAAGRELFPSVVSDSASDAYSETAPNADNSVSVSAYSDDYRNTYCGSKYREGSSMDGYLSEMKKGDYGGIEILSAKVDRSNADFEVSGVDDTLLTVQCVLEPGATVNIELECKLTVPVCDERLGVTESTVNLSCFYPSLCVYENGAWRTEPYYRLGDPFYSETASYYLTVELPNEYTLASSGNSVRSLTSKGRARYEIEAEKIRDFSMCASADFRRIVSQANVSGEKVKVNYYYVADDDPAGVLDLAVDALETFSSAFGAYPYKEFTVAQSPLNAGGMEYGAFVIIAPTDDEMLTQETVIHETAHQWWYGAVGSDQISDAWLDEGLTEFCTGYYFRLKGDHARYQAYVAGLNSGLHAYASVTAGLENPSMSKSLDAFGSEAEYVALTYLKGALLFESVISLIGEDKFNAALSLYFKENLHKTVTPSTLIDCFERSAAPVAGIFRSWVAGKVR